MRNERTDEKYCIGDLAKHYGISTDTLRLYDKVGVLTSCRAENGYRYYTREDFIRLGYILRLRKNNLPLADISALMRSGTLEDVAAAAKQHGRLLAEQRLEINALYESNQRFLAGVDSTLELLGKIDLCLSPRIVCRALDIPFSEAIDLFRALPGRPEPELAFLVPQKRAASMEYRQALERACAREFGTEMVLLLEDTTGTLAVPDNSGLTVLPPQLCLVSGIFCHTGKDYSSHVRVLQYADEHGYRINGDIIWNPTLHTPALTDYYRLYVPVAKRETDGEEEKTD